MIVTLTPNPSLDLLFRTERLLWDDANRVPLPRRRPGGQGINVVRALRALDPAVDALAIAPLGGRTGAELRDWLEAEGVPLHAVEVAGETRVFVGVRESGTGRSLLLNPRGPTADPALADALLDAVTERLDPATPGWLATCGSLLPGLPADLYARAGSAARDRGWRFVPDCDGDALAAAVEAGCDLLVPNAHEAGRLVGREVQGPEAAADAAAELLGRGPALVAITLGEAGAVAADREGVWWAEPRVEGDVAREAAGASAVGAGDAFLAALLLSLVRGAPTAQALELAVATGTATLLGTGAELVRREAVDRVRPHVRLRPLRGAARM